MKPIPDIPPFGHAPALSPEQIEMLKMSDDDILNNRVVSQSELDKMDADWFSE